MQSDQPPSIRRRRRSLRGGLVALVLLAGGIIPFALGGSAVAAPAATRAAASPDAASCDFTEGTTGTIKESGNGPAPVNGTVFTFPAGTSCHDLNISYASASDQYEAWLFFSGPRRWEACTEGFESIGGGQHSVEFPPVLCTDIKPGAHMEVVSGSGKPRTITVED